MDEFRWTFDQFQRYAVLRELLGVFHPGGKARVLDVGGLSPDRTGAEFWLPVRAVHPGEAVVLDLPDARLPGYVRGDGISLPFEDASFDVVAALDVLEHVPRVDRPRFLAELARVARETVFVCAPFRSPDVETSDGLLFDQVRRMFGDVQVQLCEHREHGLPDRDGVDARLASEIAVGGGFLFGSLLTWLPYQTLKNAFIGERNSGLIHALLDRWMVSEGGFREFEPPFARAYWVRSRRFGQADFDERLNGVRERIRFLSPPPPPFEELVRLNREMVAFATAFSVSGVVASFGHPERLAGALDTLLTQDVDFLLEVAVWDLSGGRAAEAFVQGRYPQVKYIAAVPGRPALAALGDLLGKLRGGSVLLMSEDILLKTETVRDLASKMRSGGEPTVLAPVIVESGGARRVEAGRREGTRLVPREIPLGPDADGRVGFDWVRGECLFFPRAALWTRQGAEKSLNRTTLFFWERTPDAPLLRVAGDMVVSKHPETGGEDRLVPLRIVHCLHQYHPARGGAEWLMQNVSERLAARGHDVSVVSTTACSTEDYFLPRKGKNLLPAGDDRVGDVFVRRVPFSRRGAALLNAARAVAIRIPFVPWRNRLRMISWGPRSAAYRRFLAARTDADIIGAAPLPNMNVWYAWRAARKTGRPFVIIPCFHTEDAYSFHNLLYYRMMREADAVIALTESEKSFLCREAKLDPGQVHVLGVGIDTPSEEPTVDIRAKYGIRQSRIVLFLGQHGRHKGILDLLYAMRTVWSEHPDCALVIAGNPTAHTAEIEANIACLSDGERERVHLIKDVPEPEKRAFYQAADMFVSVSPFESFGIVYLEAWREKRPVIGCRRGAASMLIEEFRDGLLVHDGNPVELAGAIAELLCDDASRTRMGEAGYAKVLEKYRWERIIDRWEAVYQEAHGKRRKARA